MNKLCRLIDPESESGGGSRSSSSGEVLLVESDPVDPVEVDPLDSWGRNTDGSVFGTRGCFLTTIVS